MKKILMGLTLAALSLAPMTAMAQDAATAENNQVKANKEYCIKGDKGCKRAIKMQKLRAKCLRVDSIRRCRQFEGMTLTESQKSKLQDLDKQRQAARDKKMAERCQQKEARKAERKAECQRRDSSICAERRAEQKEYLKNVKEIVGPDNYVIFLENNYMHGDRKPDYDQRRSCRKIDGNFKACNDKNKKAKFEKKGDCKGKKGDCKYKKGDRKGKKGNDRPRTDKANA